MQCSVNISDSTGFYPTPCAKPAKVERGGKWFCTIHDPEYIKRKEIAWAAKYEAKEAVWVKDHRLQIAAPDMYMALKNMVALAIPLFSDAPQMEALKQAGAAIAKAEGKLK